MNALDLKKLPQDLSVFYTPASGEESWPILSCTPTCIGDAVQQRAHGRGKDTELLCIVRRDLPADKAITLHDFLIYATGGKCLPIVLYETKYDDSLVTIKEASIQDDGQGAKWIELTS